MEGKMKAVLKVEAAPGATVALVDIPPVGSRDVLVQVKAASICGTDMHIYEWDGWAQSRVSVPRIFGHEFAGEVVEVGVAVVRVVELPPAACAAVDRIEPPFAGDALQLGRPALTKLKAGAGDQILHRARDEHLAGLRGLRDSRADVDGDSAHLAFDHLALTGVQAGTDLQTQLLHRLGDRAGAADRSSRPVEAGEETVTGRIELRSVIADELSTDDRVVPLEELAPCPVAELHRMPVRKRLTSRAICSGSTKYAWSSPGNSMNSALGVRSAM